MSFLATTHDQLCQGRLTLEQPEKGYRFNTDTVLLAASVQASAGQSVLELGCGIGAVLLAASLRCPDLSFTGIERETVYADLAIKNARSNNLSERVSIIKGDITDKALFKEIATFDHVLANPPYFAPQIRHEVTELRRTAREEDIGLAEWLQAANRYLKPKGSVTFIHAADRLDDLINGLRLFCGDITIFPFFSAQDQAAKRVIIRGIKGSKAPLTLLPGLVLHAQGDKYYTERAENILRHGQGLWQV